MLLEQHATVTIAHSRTDDLGNTYPDGVFVGPMIAADAQTPLERVRRKLEETFGAFELPQTPEPSVGGHEEDLVRVLSEGIRTRRLVEDAIGADQRRERRIRQEARLNGDSKGQNGIAHGVTSSARKAISSSSGRKKWQAVKPCPH